MTARFGKANVTDQLPGTAATDSPIAENRLPRSPVNCIRLFGSVRQRYHNMRVSFLSEVDPFV